METQTRSMPRAVPLALRLALRPIAQKVFWWGKPDEWLEDSLRFVAQVMVYGDLDDVRTTFDLLGKDAFLDVLNSPPPGVFDQKSWTFWHLYYSRPVPSMPVRRL